ncbi:MAG: choice-of-anchor L domain-containing protein [Saprospiraceae bacterium]|nr:choice-of-anchor L domain-containing protein [Saprospiraceae bacterium]
MKKLILLLTGCVLSARLLAQAPSNDNCDAPIPLGIAPTCTNTVYTTAGATPTDIGSNNIPSCLTSAPSRDVWFTFECPSSPLDFRIQLTGTGANSIQNPVVTVYRGDCSPEGLFELACFPTTLGATTLYLDLEALTGGATYVIRVSDNSPDTAPQPGTFTLCVDEIPPIVTIDQGSTSLCSGTLYDTGGPDEDYGNDEDFTFTICPNQPSDCITFTLDYFSLDASPVAGNSGQDVLSFFDGKDANGPVLAQLNGFSGPTATVGGGGVCFQVQAHSGCLTITFQSDLAVSFEGFAGHWECSKDDCVEPSPIEVETSLVPQDIVASVIAPGTTVTITDINCAYGAYGTFNFATDNNDLGLRKGLLLTSGKAPDAIGPNAQATVSNANNTNGDPDLDYLSTILGSASKSFDGCIVEMDVFVATDELTFEYVFGSEEYPDFVNNVFNDIFAFFASGPGIVGDPNLNGAKNIAILPNTTTPVQINSVNYLTNWEYYRNNGVLTGSTLSYNGFTSDYLGAKKSLTARVDVTPCNTYHLKLAVADRGDPALDSGVFISEVKGGAPNLDLHFASGIDYFIEDCSGNLDQLVITLSKPKSAATTYSIDIGGTATQGLDYLLNIPPVITFEAGDTLLSFPIQPLTDNLPEGTETITISISTNFGCGTVVFETIHLEIKDNAEVLVNAGADTVYVCAGGTVQLEATGALDYFWQPPLVVSDPFSASPSITPSQDLLLQVTGTIGTCTDIDSVWIRVIAAPTLDVQSDDSPLICQGDTLQLLALSNAGAAGLQWSPKSRLSDPASASPLAYPLETTTYTATLWLPGCLPVSDAITVVVDTLFFPALIPDRTSCQNYPVQLAPPLSSSTTYAWLPTAGLNFSNLAGPIAIPDTTTTYTLTATSAKGACSKTDSVTLTVTPADVNILDTNYLEICLGTTVQLNAEASPAGDTIHWSPALPLSSGTGLQVTTTPTESLTVLATYTINGCTVRDSVRIRVDSLPDLTIKPEPDRPVYCPGDIIILKSEKYTTADFTGMTHTWDSFPTQFSPLDSWSMVIEATSTHTFQRISTNHGCVDTAEILVRVGIPPNISLSVFPPEICPGQSAALTAVVVPNQQVEWEDPANTLSCTDCLLATATPNSSTQYTISTPGADCPASATATVLVLPLPVLNLVDQPICLGNSIVLNNVPTDPDDQYTWTASPPGAIDNPKAASPEVTPLVTTTYTVTAIGQCNTQGSVTITVNSGTIDAGAQQTICKGSPVTLSAIASGSAGTITWLPLNSSGNPVTDQPDSTTTYTAVLDFGNQCLVKDSVQVVVIQGVTLQALAVSPAVDSLCAGRPLLLKTKADPAGASLVWSENGLPIPGATLDSLAVAPPFSETPVTVRYSVVATDAYGCTASRSFEQVVKPCFVFPNVFTPDNDQVNDVFSGIVAYDGSVDVAEFRVFNRWGQKVFQARPGQQSWDGLVDGKEAPSDVYAYFITIRFSNGTEKTFQGDVTLLR